MPQNKLLHPGSGSVGVITAYADSDCVACLCCLLTCSPVFHVWRGPDCLTLQPRCPGMRPSLRCQSASPADWCCTAAGGATARCTVAAAWGTLLQMPASGRTRLEREGGESTRWGQRFSCMVILRKATSEQFVLTEHLKLLTRAFYMTC